MKTELKQRMNKVSARSLDGNVVMGMAEWNAIVNLVSNILSEPVASVPQDVEGFIVENELPAFGDDSKVFTFIRTATLRAWMAGHVRVPVEALKEVIRISDRKHEAWDAVKAAMLTASKEGGK